MRDDFDSLEDFKTLSSNYTYTSSEPTTISAKDILEMAAKLKEMSKTPIHKLAEEHGFDLDGEDVALVPLGFAEAHGIVETESIKPSILVGDIVFMRGVNKKWPIDPFKDQRYRDFWNLFPNTLTGVISS